jgi:hypothetical protein
LLTLSVTLGIHGCKALAALVRKAVLLPVMLQQCFVAPTDSGMP